MICLTKRQARFYNHMQTVPSSWRQIFKRSTQKCLGYSRFVFNPPVKGYFMVTV